MSPKTIAKYSAVILTAFLLGACSSSSSPTPVPPTSVPPTSAPAATSAPAVTSAPAATNAPAASTSSVSGENALQTALQKLAQATGFHFIYTRNKISVEGDAVGLQGSTHFVAKDGDTSPASISGEWIIIPSAPGVTPPTADVYFKVADKWAKLDKNSADVNILQQYTTATIIPPAVAAIAAANLKAAMTDSSAFKVVGTDTINGDSADHYSMTTTTASSELGGGGTQQVDIWISKSSGDVVKITSATTSGTTTNSATFEFSKIGTPVTITAPI